MEVRERRSWSPPVMHSNYVSLNDLKERWLKKQQEQAEIDAALDLEMREKAAAEAEAERERREKDAVEERERREKEAVESRKRREKVLVREVWWSRTETEEGGSGERREKAPVIALGERERREKEVLRSRTEKAEEGGNWWRREKVAAREARWGRTEKKLEGGNGKRREKETVEATKMPREKNGEAETLEGGNWMRREKAVVEEKNGGAEKLEGGNWMRREKAVVEAKIMPRGGNGEAEKLEGGNWERREKAVVEVTKMPRGENGEAEKLEGGNWKRREKVEGINGKKKKKKCKKNKGKAKADETLGEASGKTEKVPETQREKVEGGNRKRSEKVREKVPEDPTVVMNGRVWVKKATLAVVDPRAEIECKFADFSLREKNGGGGRRENRKDETVRKFDKKIGDLGKSEKSKKGESSDVKENVEREIKQRSGDKKGGNVGKNSLGTRFRNLGKNIGYKALDSSLVWVRKEDKSEICVAGNCSEGVLAKAGESEKKPGRGRP